VANPRAICRAKPDNLNLFIIALVAYITLVIICVFRHRHIVESAGFVTAIWATARSLLSLKPANYTQHMKLVTASQDRLAGLGSDALEADSTL
jgi:hypothetical protein